MKQKTIDVLGMFALAAMTGARATYGVGPLLAVMLVVWLTTSVSGKQDEQIKIATKTRAAVAQQMAQEQAAHAATNALLEGIAGQLAAQPRAGDARQEQDRGSVLRGRPSFGSASSTSPTDRSTMNFASWFVSR